MKGRRNNTEIKGNWKGGRQRKIGGEKETGNGKKMSEKKGLGVRQEDG